MIGFNTNFEIEEWITESVHADFTSILEPGTKSNFSTFSFEIEVTRHAGFYLWKVILPILIVVIISFSVFWMDVNNLSDRMFVSMTGLLTSVAYQFIISESLPRLSYITLMDIILSFSYCLMAVMVVLNVYINYIHIEYYEKSLKINLNSRWMFPFTYFLGLMIVVILYYFRKSIY